MARSTVGRNSVILVYSCSFIMEGSQGKNVEAGTGREAVRQLKEIKEVYIRKEDVKVSVIKDSIIEYTILLYY